MTAVGGQRTAEVADLRAEIRHWRRGRVSTSLGEVLQDAYVAVFSAVVIGAMVGNALLVLRRDLGVACARATCQDDQRTLPWLVTLLSLLAVLSVARLLGPVFVSPAVSSWLMTAPIDRSALLRRRLVVAVLAGVVAGPLVLPAALLGGLAPASVIGLSVGSGLVASALVAAAAGSQTRDGASRLAPVLMASLAALAWLVLLGLALDVPLPLGDPPAPVWVALVAVAGVLAALITASVARGLGRTRRARIARGGELAPALSGALASLDLALLYDVVLGHRWRSVGAVRPSRRGPGGVLALVYVDLVRARRSPLRLVALASVVVVPYAATAVGAGRLTVLITVVAGFLATVSLLLALRVLTRSPALARMLPFADGSSRLATLAVPGGLAVVVGLASAPALVLALGGGWSTALLAGLAVGVGILAAASRWVCGRPPDYQRPLVATPGGAVPTNLYGSVLRGFDISVLASLPLLIWATPTGATVSLAASAIVLSVLVQRR